MKLPVPKYPNKAHTLKEANHTTLNLCFLQPIFFSSAPNQFLIFSYYPSSFICMFFLLNLVSLLSCPHSTSHPITLSNVQTFIHPFHWFFKCIGAHIKQHKSTKAFRKYILEYLFQKNILTKQVFQNTILLWNTYSEMKHTIQKYIPEQYSERRCQGCRVFCPFRCFNLPMRCRNQKQKCRKAKTRHILCISKSSPKQH